MNYLVIVAHPDDEVLGIGGTIYQLSKNNNVSVCVLCSNAEARSNNITGNRLIEQFNEVMSFLNVKKTILGVFPNLRMNTVPHLDLVQFIEKSIIDTEADIIITHVPYDLNNDHKITSQCSQEAIRIFERRDNLKPITAFYYMEILSSTDWNLTQAFNPTTFIEIGTDGLTKKIEALQKYDNVIKEFPHPRSIQNIKALATYRGCQSKLEYAEALELAFKRGF